MQEAKKYFDSVIKRDGRTTRFDREKVTNAIFAAAQAVGGKDRWIAEELTDKIVQQLKEVFGNKNPTVEEIQDIVERILIKEGYADTAKTFILYREQRRQLRDTKSFLKKAEGIIDGYLIGNDWRVKENANETYSMTGLQAHISGNIVAEYTLNNIYPKEISDAHRNADLHIHDLSHGVFAAYSFYRNETIIVREKDSENVQNLSFEQLFEKIDSKVIEENSFQIKYPLSELEVWDENGWTKLERVLRHKTDKKLVSLNTSNGKNVILTEDHPFITLADKKQSLNCPNCNSLKIVKNRTNKIGKDYFKCRDCSKNFSKPVEKAPNLSEREIIAAGGLALNNIAISPRGMPAITQDSAIKPEDAWFVGFFAAEGYFKQKHLMFDLKKDSKDSLKLINYLKNNCFAHTINYRVKNKEESPNSPITSQIVFDTVVIGILQEFLSESLQEMFQTIRAGAENKNFPTSFLNQTNEVIGAMVSGLIDGDGVVRNDDPWVSRVNVRVVSKTILGQVQNWLVKEKMKSSLSTIDSFGNRKFKGKTISPKKQLYSLSFYIPQAKKGFFKECIKIDENFKFSKTENEGKNYASFRKIEQVKNDSEFVYDITTSTHSFICNGVLVHNCAGWSFRQLLTEGFRGVSGRIAAGPAGHMHAVVGQLVNFFGTLQNEWAGAQAVSSFDTYLAPFIWKEGLSYEEVKQGLQEFVYSVNQTSRWGNQPPFTNITLDWTVPEDMKDMPVIIKGKVQDQTYSEFQDEMDLINRAFLDMMIKGDSDGRTFSFPIPTYNLTRDFNWDSENAELLFEMTAKYGIPYFQNFINSSLKPHDVRSMCLEAGEKIIFKSNGKIQRQTIKQFCEENSAEFNGEWAETGKEVFSLSLNPETYNLEWAKVKSFYKTTSNKIVKIRGKDGKSLKVSEDHPVAVYCEGGIKTKRAAEIKVGDFLIQTKNAADCLSNKPQEIDGMQLDEELARFLGLFTAEGNYLFDSRPRWKGRLRGMQFSFNFEKEKELVSFVSDFAEKRFGVKAKLRKDPRYNTAYCLLYNGKLAETLIKNGFNKKGKLPEAIFNSPKEVVRAFIDGFAEGDAYAKGKEIHINDKELAEDLSILCSLVGIPSTLRIKKNSQVLRFQHVFGRGSMQKITKNDCLYNRLPQFIVQTSKSQPFYAKQFMVSLSAIEKHSAHTEESKRLAESDFCIVRAESVIVEENEKEFEFFDIELEKNHYFVHSLGSITHNCCRLQLDLNELRKLKSKTGGLFGAGESTGSVGVVTINMPHLAFLSRGKSEKEFFARLERLMVLAKESLEIKRKEVQKNMDQGLLPYTRKYLGNLNNHFATIGLNGMHEACLNFLGPEKGIQTPEGKAFALRVLDFMREKLQEFQAETGHMYNLEATPGEGTSYRFARHDQKNLPGILQAGKNAPYYTNSSHLPVDYTDDIFDALDHQDELQCKYTGGTVLHGFIGEKISSPTACKKLVRKIAENYHLPYFTITPTFSICKKHGYIAGNHETCPVVVKTNMIKERALEVI